MQFFSILTRLSVVLAAVLASDVPPDSPDSIVPTLSGTEFKASISSGSWFIKFYSPTCSHCKALAPHWEKAGTVYQSLGDTHNFHLASVNCLVSGDICNAEGILGYPTLYLYQDGVKVDEYLNIASDDPLVPISNFIEKHAQKSFPEEPIDDSRVEFKKEPEVKQTKVKAAASPDFVKGQKTVAQNATPVATPASDVKKAEETSAVQNPVKNARPMMQSDFRQNEKPPKPPASSLNPTGTSVNLVPETFTNLVTNTRDGWFIKFYVPWCTHCQAMAPAWAELANDSVGELNVGEVNCEAESRLCKDIKIHGYPTLLFFQGEEHIEYTGLRGLGDLRAFVTKAATAGVRDVDAVEFEAIQKKEEVIFLYFYDDATTSEDFAALQKTSLELIGHAPLLKTSSSILASRFRATTFPKMMVIRDGTPQYYNALGPADMRDHHKILAWMKSAWLPIVPELSPENSHEIMENRIVVLSVLDPEDTNFEKDRATMRDTAHAYTEQRTAEEQTEKQGLRDKKQTKIDDATKKGDTKAIQNAKEIRVKVADKQEIGFAWVNGLFWKKWLAAAYGIDVAKDGAKVIINDEDQNRFWDVDANGHVITLSKSAILDTLTVVISSPNKIRSKSTKTSLEAAYYAARRAGTGHPYLILALSIGLLAAILLILTRSKTAHKVTVGSGNRGGNQPFANMNGKFD